MATVNDYTALTRKIERAKERVMKADLEMKRAQTDLKKLGFDSTAEAEQELVRLETVIEDGEAALKEKEAHLDELLKEMESDDD